MTGSIAGAATVSSGATLNGSGTITGAVTVNSGGTLAPGTSPGIINTGNLSLASGSTFSIEINGTTVGTEYDQTNVTGTVSLGSATLSTTFGFTPALGQTFTIIANDGSDAVSGTFSGLAQGATFTSGSRTFQISYTGGTGNDVVLTVVDGTPTITDIANQTIDEDAATSALAFTVGDTETAVGSLTVSGSSSNTTLVPAANIVFGGSGASRTVTVTPAADQNGTVTITVTVSDGGLSASDTFTLTMTSVNDAPTIADLPQSQTINEDAATGALTFTIGDVETDATLLTLTGKSSNVTLVPHANIVFGGSGASRTVTITPAANQSGVVTINVTVSDGTLTTDSDNLILTITAVSDAPTISDIANQTIDEDTATSALSFTIGDAETAASSLTLSSSSSNTTVVPAANIVFGGSGASRTVTVTPAANQPGAATITVTVSDGTSSTSDVFTVTVNPVNDAPTIAGPGNQTMAPGATLGPLAVTVADVETSASLLTLSGATSNPTLVSVANLTFGGTGSARTVTMTPAAASVGVATITLTVSDGTLSSSTSFTVTVGSALTLEKTGSGSGTVGTTTDPRRCGSPAFAEASAGQSCQETYTSAETVRLVAAPDPQSGFAGWTGDPDCADGVVTMNANLTCRARFTSLPAGATVDLNADAVGDVFGYDLSSGNWTEWIGQVAGGFSPTLGSWSPGWVIRAADFDGNGRPDLFLYNPIDGLWFQAFSEPTAGMFRYVSGTWSPRWTTLVLDLNADGRSDVFLYNPIDGLWVNAFALTGGDFSYSPVGQWSPNWDVYPAEFTGDAFPDLFLHNAETGVWFRVLNVGANVQYVSGIWSPSWQVFPADLNADRLTDFLLYNRTTGAWRQARTSGNGFDEVSGTWDPGWTVRTSDLNGDQRDDVFLYNETSGVWVEALIGVTGGFTFYNGTWDPGWQLMPTRSAGLLLYAPASGVWVRALPAGPGSFTYMSGTFESGRALVVTGPRVW